VKYKAVLFDLGSTLINYDNNPWDELGRRGCEAAGKLLDGMTKEVITPERLWEDFHYAIDMMFENHSADLTEIDIYEVTTRIFANLGITSPDGLVSRFVDTYYQPITTQITLIPGAGEILKMIKSSGAKIGLVSNTVFPAKFHRAEMARFGIQPYFDFTIFSSELGYRKPKKDIYFKALELAGTQPHETIFVGDRLVEDVGGPQSAGIKGILKFTDGRDYSAPVTPYKTIHELSELEPILLS
jgi:HAD superfamily hydrolase (TIGR01509 family)